MAKNKKRPDAEQKIRAVMQGVVGRSNYAEAYAKDAQENPLGFVQIHFPALAAYLTMFSLDRQERVSRSLYWHSWAMVGLTLVILAGVIAQIYLALTCR